MQIIVKSVDGHIVISDENGNLLPNVSSARVNLDAGDIARLTIEFTIGGDVSVDLKSIGAFIVCEPPEEV